MKIISGGQSGVDRAALDFCLENNFHSGGWCPKGRKAEDGRIHDKYPLTETESENYDERTRLNVENSDGTLVIIQHNADTGTQFTIQLLNAIKKPFLLIDLADNKTNVLVVRDWIYQNKIEVLNVAGPRESKSIGIYKKSKELLEKVFILVD